MSSRKANRLVHETSPYLLQHAYNPVDWFPWGEEAFEKARRESKPLLISIGYSTCHWCHVMEHECFENEAIAAQMNMYVVAIKVDREERPDIDKIYMTAISAMTGQGGWPLNVFVTPELKPIFGGTYFPPVSKWGQPAWPDVIRHIGESWKDAKERGEMEQAAQHVTESLQRYIQQTNSPVPLSREWVHGGYSSLESTFDEARGGFGGAPKFPMPVYHHFLLRYGADHANPKAINMSLATLRAMGRGGIYDQLGGGFARYSTDAYWHVPHFEKMLYDNAQLATIFLEAYQISQDPFFELIARETLEYIHRDMTAPSGAFYSAEDADSLPTTDSTHKTEGAFYVWEKGELELLLGESAAAIVHYLYGIRADGNARVDPHGEFTKKNILYIAHPIPEVAREFKRSESEVIEILTSARQTLLNARSKRPRPHLDDKHIAAWNGLMISAMAKGSLILKMPAYLDSARKAASEVLQSLFDSKAQILYRSTRNGKRNAKGIGDDYAFMVQALLDLYEVDPDSKWMTAADTLNTIFLERFYDSARHGFYMTASDQDTVLLLRMSEDQDNVEPAASSVAVSNLTRLAWMMDDDSLLAIARNVIEALGDTLRDSPRALPCMLSAMDQLLEPPQELVIVGNPMDPAFQQLRAVRAKYFLPRLHLYGVNPDAPASPLKKYMTYKAIHGKPTAYLCVNHACQAPTTDPGQLDAQLKALGELTLV